MVSQSSDVTVRTRVAALAERLESAEEVIPTALMVVGPFFVDEATVRQTNQRLFAFRDQVDRDLGADADRVDVEVPREREPLRRIVGGDLSEGPRGRALVRREMEFDPAARLLVESNRRNPTRKLLARADEFPNVCRRSGDSHLGDDGEGLG